jgi:hypothetical protein
MAVPGAETEAPRGPVNAHANPSRDLPAAAHADWCGCHAASSPSVHPDRSRLHHAVASRSFVLISTTEKMPLTLKWAAAMFGVWLLLQKDSKIGRCS